MPPRLTNTPPKGHNGISRLPEQSAIPGQNITLKRAYSPAFQPDVAQAQRVKRLRRFVDFPAAPTDIPVMTRPGIITMSDLHGIIATASALQLAIPSNPYRRRFCVSNPSTSVSVLNMYFKNSPNSPISLLPGAVWDEIGSEISIDEIYVSSVTAGQIFGAYEGVYTPALDG